MSREASVDDRPALPGRSRPHWSTSELVAIGVFAALIRIAGLAIVLAGGGMNPLALMLRNLAATALLVVLLHKSQKSGTLSLYIIIYSMLSVLLMGSGLMSLPATLLVGLLVDGLFVCCGGYRTTGRILLAVGLYDLLTRCISLGIGYLTIRESPSMFIMAAGIVALAYLGCLAGLWVGARFVRDLRAAGVIRQ
jgi:energy-coupling factor transport system substrate-specific component